MIGDAGEEVCIFGDWKARGRQLKLIPKAADVFRLGEDAVGVGKQPLGRNLRSMNGCEFLQQAACHIRLSGVRVTPKGHDVLASE